MSVEGRRPRHKPDGDSHNGSAADSDSARGSSILSSPTTPQQPSCCGFSLRGVAQLVARLVRDQEAVGSNPVTPTKRASGLSRRPFLFFVYFYRAKPPSAAGRGLCCWCGYKRCYASTPQASIWVRAGKGDGSSALMSSNSFRLCTVRGARANTCGAAVLVSCKTSRLPSSNATVACVQ